MAEQLGKTGKELNATFLPASLLRKNQNKLATSLTSKYQFQKTSGNAFIIIDPQQIKFAGYELEKSYTATVRVINRAPIPQRVTFMAPENEAFAIKTNKKGSIASGMSQTITVLFRSSQFKYQTDAISIRTETQNFVIPLYAYPTLPDLRTIFPKVIDFGSVEVRQPSTFYYPIKNSVPLNFQFQFSYLKQCHQISINPLKGVIQSQSTTVVQISFLPTAKCTFSAEVQLMVHQFDFQPIPITIMGSGFQKSQSQQKRVRSSKLAPLKQAEEGKKTPQPFLKRKPSNQVPGNTNSVVNLGVTNPNLSQTANNFGNNTMKRVTLRQKFVSTKKAIGQQDLGKTLNPAKIAEKEYLNHFGRIEQLDKQKQIKFKEYLGDKALTPQQIQFQQHLVREIESARAKALEKKCVQRYQPEKNADIAVQYKTVAAKTVSWDDKQNDQHHNRRNALLRFMTAGTKIILKYRILKRLGKIREFLSGCSNREEVKKLVQQSHAKALDQHQGYALPPDITFDFDRDSLRPSYFQLQHDQNSQKQSSTTFRPQGKALFDDLAEIKLIEPNNAEQFRFSELPFPADYFHHLKYVPPLRQSGEDQWYLKTSALPNYEAEPMTSVYELALKVPSHHFIYDNHSLRRYKNYVSCDEKDPQVYLQTEGAVEDQFQGWTGGEMQILKYKFTRNLGCEYTTFNGFNYSSEMNPLPPLSTLGQNLPKLILQPQLQDTLAEGDSDQQDLVQTELETAQKFMDKLETNNDIKQRRAKKEVRNPEGQVRAQIEKSLHNLKAKTAGEFVGKVKQANKWVQHSQNRFLL